jgi:hypothetical protein
VSPLKRSSDVATCNSTDDIPIDSRKKVTHNRHDLMFVQILKRWMTQDVTVHTEINYIFFFGGGKICN